MTKHVKIYSTIAALFTIVGFFYLYPRIQSEYTKITKEAKEIKRIFNQIETHSEPKKSTSHNDVTNNELQQLLTELKKINVETEKYKKEEQRIAKENARLLNEAQKIRNQNKNLAAKMNKIKAENVELEQVRKKIIKQTNELKKLIQEDTDYIEQFEGLLKDIKNFDTQKKQKEPLAETKIADGLSLSIEGTESTTVSFKKGTVSYIPLYSFTVVKNSIFRINGKDKKIPECTSFIEQVPIGYRIIAHTNGKKFDTFIFTKDKNTITYLVGKENEINQKHGFQFSDDKSLLINGKPIHCSDPSDILVLSGVCIKTVVIPVGLDGNKLTPIYNFTFLKKIDFEQRNKPKEKK